MLPLTPLRRAVMLALPSRLVRASPARFTATTRLGELFHETWMGAMRPIPPPDTTVPPRPLEFYEEEAKQACDALLDAIKKKGILGR